jgi:hypothetical protein
MLVGMDSDSDIDDSDESCAFDDAGKLCGIVELSKSD